MGGERKRVNEHIFMGISPLSESCSILKELLEGKSKDYLLMQLNSAFVQLRIVFICSQEFLANMSEHSSIPAFPAVCTSLATSH